MKTTTKLIKISKWIDNEKVHCTRINTELKRIEIDSALYTRMMILQYQIGALLVRIDQMEKRRYSYK